MDKVWDKTKRCEVDMPKEMEDFLNDIKSVCLKHNLSISHEDYNGVFLIEEYDEDNIRWLFDASKNYEDEVSEEHKRTVLLELAESNTVLSNENKILNEEICQLKVKYAEEVKKNFYLTNRLFVNRLKIEL